MISPEDDVAQSMRRAEMFSKVLNSLGDCRSGTVAGAPSGLSPSRSQAKPLIDYRKEADND